MEPTKAAEDAGHEQGHVDAGMRKDRTRALPKRRVPGPYMAGGHANDVCGFREAPIRTHRLNGAGNRAQLRLGTSKSEVSSSS